MRDEEPVDVLIIGAGAVRRGHRLEPRRDAHERALPRAGRLDGPGAATRPRPGLGDRAASATSRSARTRAGAPRTTRSTTASRRSRVSNFNAVGGSTILYAGHFPRFHPSDFRVRSLDGVADDWPIDYALLEPYYAQNDRMMGVAGLAGDPAYPPKELPLPPVPLGKLGETARARLQPPRLALVALGQRHRDRRPTRGARRASTSAPASRAARRARRRAPTSPTGRPRSAPGVRARGRAAACARSRVGANGLARRRRSTTTRRAASAARRPRS